MAILDGAAIAAARRENVKRRAEALRARGIIPTIAPVLVAGNKPGEVYYNHKRRLARELGIAFHGVTLPPDATKADIVAAIARLNADPLVHGVFVELPLPAGVQIDAVAAAIAPEKDIDALNPADLGRLLAGGARSASYTELRARPDVLLPATAFGVIELLIAAGVDPVGKETVIIGGGTTGIALSTLVLRWGYGTVTVCEYRGRDLRAIVPRGDIVIACAGKPNLVTADMVRDGAVVIDVGINVTADGIVGDVDFDAVQGKAALITPVPGGVGPMTTTMIMENTVKAAENLSR